MITRQKHNESRRKAGRERAQHLRDKYMESGVRRYADYTPEHKHLGEEERQAIREKIRKDYLKSSRRSIAVFIGAILLLGFICFIILYYY